MSHAFGIDQTDHDAPVVKEKIRTAINFRPVNL